MAQKVLNKWKKKTGARAAVAVALQRNVCICFQWTPFGKDTLSERTPFPILWPSYTKQKFSLVGKNREETSLKTFSSNHVE